jgi:hypothetical protein
VSDHDPVVLFLSDSAFASADLAASVLAADGSVAIGQDAAFGVGVGNAGPDAAAPVALDLVLDAAVPGLRVTAAAGWNCDEPQVLAASTTVHCRIATLAAGSSGSFIVVAPTDRELGGRALTLSARISSPMTDLATLNNSATASVQVTASADLAAAVLAPKGPLAWKKAAVFAIGIANQGPHAARAAVLAIAVNAPKSALVELAAGGLDCVNTGDSPTLSTWTCRGGEYYEAGRFDGLVLTLDASRAASGTLSVGASFNSATSDPRAGNNSAAAAVRVVGPPVTIH